MAIHLLAANPGTRTSRQAASRWPNDPARGPLSRSGPVVDMTSANFATGARQRPGRWLIATKRANDRLLKGGCLALPGVLEPEEQPELAVAGKVVLARDRGPQARRGWKSASPSQEWLERLQIDV